MARRLRIAFVVDTWDGVQTGGVVSARRFVAALRERHEVTVVTTGPAGADRIALPGFYAPGFGRVMREMGFVFAVPRRRVLEELFRRVDLVHVQFPFWLGLRAARIAERVGTPLVAGFHVQPENLFLNVGLRSEALVRLTYRLFVRELFDRAQAVVCPSAFALGELRRHGLRAPGEVISNGVAERFTPVAAARLPRPEGRLLVLAVGRLAREKRHDVIVEGVRRSRHAARIQLIVSGRGPEERRVRRLCAALPVPGEVLFASDEDLLRLYRTADLLVHASEVELEGMAVLEALGCGTPALVADVPASAARELAVLPELLFRAGDPGDLARRLDALAEAPALLAEARRRARQAAEERSLGRSVAALEDLFQRVARPAWDEPPPRSAGALTAAAPGAGSRARPAGR